MDDQDAVWLSLEAIQNMHQRLDRLTLKAVEAAGWRSRYEYNPNSEANVSETEFVKNVHKMLDDKLEAMILKGLGLARMYTHRGKVIYGRDSNRDQTGSWDLISARVKEALETHVQDWTLEKLKKSKRYQEKIKEAENVFIDAFCSALVNNARDAGYHLGKKISADWGRHIEALLKASFAKQNPVLEQLSQELKAKVDSNE